METKQKRPFSLLPTVYGEWHTALKRSEDNTGNMVSMKLPATISEAIEESVKWKMATTGQIPDMKPAGIFLTDTPPLTLVFGKPALPKPQAYGNIDPKVWKAATPEERRAVMDHNNALRAEVNKIPPKRNKGELSTDRNKESPTVRTKEGANAMITTQTPKQEPEVTYSYAILTYMIPMDGESHADLTPSGVRDQGETIMEPYDEVVDEDHQQQEGNVDRVKLYSLKHIPTEAEIMSDYSDQDGDDAIEVPTQECLYTDTVAPPTFNPLHVVFDNGSAIHICSNEALALNLSKQTAKQLGGVVGNKNVTYDKSCNMVNEELGTAAFVQESVANIISQSVAEDAGVSIEFNQLAKTYTLTCPSGAIYTFGRYKTRDMPEKSSHYVMDTRTNMPPVDEQHNKTDTVMIHTTIPTIKHNKTRYTKQENQRADEAMKFLKSMGHPPKATAMSMARSMSNCQISTDDIYRAYDIYGPALEAIKGRTTKVNTKPSLASGIDCEYDADRKQIAEADLMFVYGTAYLVVILSPMEFSFAIPIEGKSTTDIHAALAHVLVECGKRNHTITWIVSDSESTMKTNEIAQLLSEFHAESDNKPSGTHAPRVERRIRFIKDKLRIILQGLPYNVTRNLLKWATQCACRMTNMQTSSSSTDNITPREKFLRRHTNYLTDVGPAFGTYVQCTVPNTNNTMEPRTEGCIMLMPKDSRDTAAYFVLKLSTGKAVVRSHYIELPIPDALIIHINTVASREGIGHPRNDTATYNKSLEEIHETTPTSSEEDTQEREYASQGEYTLPLKETEEGIFESDTVNQDGTNEERHEDHENQCGHSTTLRRSARISQLDKAKQEALYEKRAQEIADATAAQYDFAGSNAMIVDNMTLLTVKQAIEKLGDPARAAIKSELTSLLTKGTFQPVRQSELTEAQFKGVIGSKMFIKEKVNPDGTIEKIKARLVGRGDQQDHTLYHDDLGAYTVERSSIMTVAALAAKEERVVATLDVGTAYLNAKMPAEYPTIHMRIEPTLAIIVTEINPELRAYVHNNGSMYVKLLRALYGCIESAKLWQLHITSTLTDYGFQANPYDCCVLNKVIGKNQITIAIHVDDLLITSKDEDDVNRLVSHLTKVYDKVTVHKGSNLAYLGINLDFSIKGTVTITADGMVEAILADSGVNDLEKPTTSSPATAELYNTQPESPTLMKLESDHFHSMVARLAYLARMCRIECVGAVAFLTTRVTKSTEQDMQKLHHILRYIHQSHRSGHRGFRITPGTGPVQAIVYADAAYGINLDGKSQSGVAVGIGGYGFIDQYSGKQSITAKSSSEAELLCTSSETNRGIRTKNFLEGQGYPSLPVDVKQDNTSTITLLEKGKSTSIKTKHINIRHFWLKEQIDNGTITISYTPTAQMGAANILTKPVVGKQFIDERKMLCNW